MVALPSLDHQHSYGPFSHVGCQGEARQGRSRQYKSTSAGNPHSEHRFPAPSSRKNVLNKCLEFAGNHASVQPVLNWAKCLFPEHTERSLSFVTVRRISRIRLAKKKFVQLRINYVGLGSTNNPNYVREANIRPVKNGLTGGSP